METNYYLNTDNGDLYTENSVYDYLYDHCLDDDERKELSYDNDKDLSVLLEIIDLPLEELGFTYLSSNAVTKLKKLGLSTVNNCHCINDSISNKECNNSCSCGNGSLCNSDLKDIKSLTGKDILKMIEEAKFENFKNSIGANLTDEEKRKATNKVPNFYCGFIDDKEMEKSIKQLLGKMAQK